MPCLALIHAVYKVTAVIHMATMAGKLSLLFLLFACNIGFTGCFLRVSFALILVQLSISIAEMRHKQQGADRELYRAAVERRYRVSDQTGKEMGS